jgi:S-adenosylmethionine hydrolase
VFAPAAAHLALGVAPSRLGPPVEDPLRLGLKPPRLRAGRLHVPVVHVDRFGNVILGLSRSELERLAGSPGARPRLTVAGRVARGIRESYAGAPPDEPVLVWNGADDLEVAVNRGRASELLGLGVGDEVVLEVA